MKKRAYTEHMSIWNDEIYTIKAVYDENNEVMASLEEEFTHTDNPITFIHKDGTSGTRPYYFAENGDVLIIDNTPDQAWTRVG
jgi:hypothetical protein